MRRYTTKDEEDLIRQIESDPEFDKGWEQVVEGHVVEIRYVDEDDEDSWELTEETKKDIAEARAEIKAGKFHKAEEVYRELGL